MEDYKTVTFDLTYSVEERMVEMFGKEFPNPDSTITIEELMALPEEEYKNMQIAVMALKGLKMAVEQYT